VYSLYTYCIRSSLTRFDKTKDEVALFNCFPVDHFLLYVSKKCIIKNSCEKQKHPQRVEKWRSFNNHRLRSTTYSWICELQCYWTISSKWRLGQMLITVTHSQIKTISFMRIIVMIFNFFCSSSSWSYIFLNIRYKQMRGWHTILNTENENSK
jgi:hypothetical protein